MKDKTLFIEKYRPHSLDDVVGQQHVIKPLKGFVKNDKVPHMLFAGPAGTGKTTSSVAMAHDLYGKDWKKYFLEMNASDDNGIDTIRNKVKEYARVKVIGRDYKLIFLDECDSMCLTGETQVITGSLANPVIRRLDDMKEGRTIMIPSVNTDTLKLENDKGLLIDSGYTDFLEIKFENGTYVNASKNHPFFKLNGKQLIQVDASCLKVNDEVVELCNDIYNKCKVCGKFTFNKNCCSVDCQNKHHSLMMKGEGNPQYRKTAWNKGLTKETDQRVAKQAHKKQHIHNGIKIKSIKPIGKKKAWNITMNKNKNFLLSNGVLTHNTASAQAALRRIMEMYSEKCRFILSCNYPNKIIDPIKDRCVAFRFRVLTKNDIKQLLKTICDNEDINITDDGLDFLAQSSKGSMRQPLNIMFKLKWGDQVDEITKQNVQDSICYVDEKTIKKLLLHVKNGSVAETDDYVDSLLYQYSYTPVEILNQLREIVKTSKVLSSKDVVLALQAIGNTTFRISQGSPEDIELKTLAIELILLYDKE